MLPIVKKNSKKNVRRKEKPREPSSLLFAIIDSCLHNIEKNMYSGWDIFMTEIVNNRSLRSEHIIIDCKNHFFLPFM